MTQEPGRNVIEERYATLIDALYGTETAIVIDARIVYESGETGNLQRTLNLVEVA